MNKFLIWLTTSAVYVGLALIAYNMEVFHTLFAVDKSYCSYAIIAIFAAALLRSGYCYYREKENKFTKVAMDLCETLGFAGTIVGMILLFANGGTGPELVSSIKANMGVALYTTLTGIVASVLLRLQKYD